MNINFTLDNLILFAYNETETKENKEILDALNTDNDMLDDYLSVLACKTTLDNLQKDPSEQSVNNIFNYSRALNVFNLKPDVNSAFVIVN